MTRGPSTGGRGRGRGRSVGRGRGRGYSGSKKFSSSTKQEIKFFPHGSGSQQQSITYDTVKDVIVQQVQKTYKNGVDIADSLENEEMKDLGPMRPTRSVSTLTDKTAREIEQEGFDIEFRVLIEEHHKRVLQLEENKTKAYALIFSNYCNRTMQVRIEEHKDYESEIRNDPIKLLKAIRVLMHDPARAKYPYASMTEALLRALQYTKQKEEENLIDYVTRFKSAKNVLKSHVGKEVLNEFVEHTEEYRSADSTEQKEMKESAFDRWMAYLLLKNSDQKKYGSLLTGLSSQFSMGNNQYPAKITSATDVLANHKHDNYEARRRTPKKNEEKDEEKEKETRNEQSFAQGAGIVCYCCGKKGHKSPECPDKDKIPKEKWHQNMAYQNYIKAMKGEGSVDSPKRNKWKKPRQRRPNRSRNRRMEWTAHRGVGFTTRRLQHGTQGCDRRHARLHYFGQWLDNESIREQETGRKRSKDQRETTSGYECRSDGE